MCTEFDDRSWIAWNGIRVRRSGGILVRRGSGEDIVLGSCQFRRQMQHHLIPNSTLDEENYEPLAKPILQLYPGLFGSPAASHPVT